ncbi:four helix bundle protein [Candidatus Margulisiibacteriota bacterium]
MVNNHQERLQGHMKMRVWQNADRLDVMIQDLIKHVPKFQYKLIQQIDRATNSVLANFVEGYYSCSTREYIRFARYSKRSLGEVVEHLTGFYRRKYIDQIEYNKAMTLCWRTMYLIDRLLLSLEKKLASSPKTITRTFPVFMP